MADRVLLCRHMSRADEKALARVGAKRRMLDRSEPPEEPEELVAVARVLRETLQNQKIAIVAIRHATSPIAVRHATWLQGKLGLDEGTRVSIEPVDKLAPESFHEWSGTEQIDELVEALLAPLENVRVENADDPAVLVVGHMPQLCWLATRLTGNRPLWMRFADGFVTPVVLKNSEVASIELTGTRRRRRMGRLEWTVAPDESAAIVDLQEKIKSKMDIAKLLGGFMTLVLGGVILAPSRIEELSRGGDRWPVYVAAVAFLIAIGLYVRTMYAYDSLLMPVRYWGERSPGGRQPRWLVRRPPSSAAWILYQNMLHVWTFLFTPASVAVGVGLVALTYAALKPGWVAAVITVLVLVVIAIYVLLRRPVLGSQD
jgi:broad specificity phosphatase PhoE